MRGPVGIIFDGASVILFESSSVILRKIFCNKFLKVLFYVPEFIGFPMFHLRNHFVNFHGDCLDCGS
jgi:hypothetical protein